MGVMSVSFGCAAAAMVTMASAAAPEQEARKADGQRNATWLRSQTAATQNGTVTSVHPGERTEQPYELQDSMEQPGR